MPGRTDTLSSLLGTPYPPDYAVTCRGTGGRSGDPQQQQQLYSKEEIEAMIPASDAEISAALHQLGAVEIEGKLRVLSKYVLFDAMKALLQSMVALDLLWAEDGLLVSEDEGCRLLTSGGGESTPSSSSSIVDPHVLRGCLDLLGSSYCAVEADPRTRTWKLNTLEVSRMTAHLVLQEVEEEEVGGQQQRRRGSTSCTVDVSIAGRDRCSYRCRVMAANDFQFEWSMRTPRKAVTDYGGSQQLLYGLAVLSTLKSSLMQGTSSGSGSSIAVDEPCYFYLPTQRPISSTDDDQLDELPRDPKVRVLLHRRQFSLHCPLLFIYHLSIIYLSIIYLYITYLSSIYSRCLDCYLRSKTATPISSWNPIYSCSSIVPEGVQLL
jgi:hypothetical protein